MKQLSYFKQDLRRMLGKYKIRILHIWLSRLFWGILLYRTERTLYLSLGKSYSIIRVFFIPFFNVIQAYSNLDISYRADIKGGLIILHPSVGCVISGQVTAGSNLTLVGGNIIGAKFRIEKEAFSIGDNCLFGANSTLIGPVSIGNNINIGASACVTKDFLEDGSVLVGVPAKELNSKP